MKKPSLLIIFLTVFIDLIGFGIVLPLLPIFAKNFDANGFTIGGIIAIYSVMQFIFAPLWGRLSDRIGRRPILLISTAGAAISYAIFAIGSGMTGDKALIVIFISRAFAGIAGANITVAQAYIADITPPEDRSKRMGLIGMAFGLGFILGPALSGVAIHFLNATGPGWIAAGLCAANFVFALVRLPESWKPSADQAPPRPRFGQWVHTLSQPKIGLLIGIFFVATFCFTCFETTIGLLVSENFNLKFERVNDRVFVFDPKIVWLYFYCGIIGACVQGGAIGRMVKKMGEVRLIAFSMVMMALSLVPLPFVKSWFALLTVLALLSIGSSLTRPPVFGLISMLTSAAEQGTTIGVAQGAGSLARILGPIFAAVLFERNMALPYVICGILAMMIAVVAWVYLHKRGLETTKPV